MYNNTNNALQKYGHTSPDTLNSTVSISGTNISPISQVPMHLMGRQEISAENDGPVSINPRNPTISTNSRRNSSGKICTSCGKGISLLDFNLVQNGSVECLICFALICPCICCWLMCKKRKCSSCKAEIPNTRF